MRKQPELELITWMVDNHIISPVQSQSLTTYKAARTELLIRIDCITHAPSHNHDLRAARASKHTRLVNLLNTVVKIIEGT